MQNSFAVCFDQKPTPNTALQNMHDVALQIRRNWSTFAHVFLLPVFEFLKMGGRE
jgi:hypothetical protein